MSRTVLVDAERIEEILLENLAWGDRWVSLGPATGLPATRIGETIRGKRRITTETAVRLSRALGLSERYWINIQADRPHPARDAQ